MATIFVHGGVSGTEKADLPDLGEAVGRGIRSPGALDAAEAAVRALEDDERLNAGYGSVLAADGTLSLDAGLMDGRAGRVGAVAGVTVRNPISLARRVMEDTPHVLMIAAGAMALAGDLETLADTSPAQRARWLDARERGELDPARYGEARYVDTVGAVALDADGCLVAASSTGGVFGKLPGRVGDAPIPGAGFYADARCAVVGTGVGELFLESLASGRVARSIEDGMHPQEACESVIAWLGSRGDRPAGLMALDGEGRFGAAYRGGGWAVEGPDGPVRAKRVSG